MGNDDIISQQLQIKLNFFMQLLQFDDCAPGRTILEETGLEVARICGKGASDSISETESTIVVLRTKHSSIVPPSGLRVGTYV